jgi:hypothetical protein
MVYKVHLVDFRALFLVVNLLVFAVVAVLLGILEIRNNMYAPFALSNSIPSTAKEQIVANVAYEKQLDTDRDGLNNFDELNVYGTSPYLYDTYGYNMSDKDVIRQGLPLCPNAGRNCAGGGEVSTTSSVAATIVNPAEAEYLSNNTPPDINAILKDPTQIRQLLTQTGQIEPEILKKISDKDLMTMVTQAFSPSATTTSSSLKRLDANFVTPTRTPY